MLLWLEKETKMMPLPLCKKKSYLLSLLSSRTQDFIFFLFFFSCRSHLTRSFAFLNSFLLLSFLFFFSFFFLILVLHLTASLLAFFNFPIFFIFYKISHSFLFSFSFFAIPHKYRHFLSMTCKY
jgi:hypothetical protein